MNDREAFDKLKADDKSALAEIYQRNRQHCIKWAINNCYYPETRNNCSLEEAIDLYQEAIIALHQNTVSHRLTNLRVKCSTYLIAIMKNKWRSSIKKQLLPLDENIDLQFEDYEDPADIRIEVHKALGILEKGCREMLTLRYFMSFDFEDIAEVMQYKNGSTVRNLISRCRGKFRNIYTQIIPQS